MRNKQGITLIALVVTVVVTIIIAAISISVLTGDNGTINNAQKAKEDTEIAEEKEILTVSAVQAAGKDTYGNVEEDNLREQLDKNVGEYELEKVGNNFKVTFPSDRSYIVDGAGEVIEINTEDPVELVAKMICDDYRKTYYVGVGFADYQVYGDYLNYDSENAISGTLIAPNGEEFLLSTENMEADDYAKRMFQSYCYRYQITQNGEYTFLFIGDDGRYGETTIIIDSEHPQIVSSYEKYFDGPEFMLIAGLNNFVNIERGSIDIIRMDDNNIDKSIDLTSFLRTGINDFYYFDVDSINGMDLYDIPGLYPNVIDAEITFVYQGKEVKRKGTYAILPM